jgi:predicted permease
MSWSRFFRRKQWDEERARELDAYLEIETRENIARGLPPEQARHAACRKLGNSTLIREEIYRMNTVSFLESLWQDVRYGLRTLAKSPVFTLVIISSLALGIGANTAIFSLINAALLKILPVRSPEQLIEFKSFSPVIGLNDAFAYPAFKRFHDYNRVLAGVVAFRSLNEVDVEVNGQGGLASGHAVSGDYFSVLGVNALLGRTITPEDEKVPGQTPVAVIGYSYWRERFALDPAVIGKNIVLNNSPFTIIGVTPPEFYGLQPGQRIDVFVPLTMIAQVRPGWAAAGTPYYVLTSPFRNWLNVMGRLKPGVTSEAAVASLQPIFQQSMREAAQGLGGTPVDSAQVRKAFVGTALRLEAGEQGLAALRRQFSKPLWIIMAVVALLLLVTCGNVANLLLARANARQKEIAVRLTVGAGRRRLIRQLITESVLLATVGGVLGLLLAFSAGRSLLLLMAHPGSPIFLRIQPDTTVLAFTLVVSLFTALLFGLVPAWRAARLNLTPTLVETTRSSGRAGNRSMLGKMLIVFQITVSLILMIGAGLLARSLENLQNFYPGFNKENVLLLSISPELIGYKGNQLVPLYERLVDRIGRIPGVQSATFSIYSPLDRNFGFTEPNIEGAQPRSGKELSPVGLNVVGPKYFTTLQTPVMAGRDLRSSDRSGAPRVAIVNQTMARNYFGDANPLGRHLSVPGWVGDASWLEIVGIVKDAKSHDLREQIPPMIYLPLFQEPEGGITFEVRTAVDPRAAETAALRAIKAVDGRLPVSSIETLREEVDDSLVQERLVASLSTLFGALALILATVGLYGLMTYAVNRRTGEIGIRVALGARRGQIAGMVLKETLLLVVIGLAIGVPAALAASRLIRSELYGLNADDPATVVVAGLLMACIAALAGYLPARRASRVDPMIALRHE